MEDWTDGFELLGADDLADLEKRADEAAEKRFAAEDAKKVADANAKKGVAASALKTAGSVLDSVTSFFKPSTPTMTPIGPQQSWFSRPVLGPLPGGAVAALGAAVVGVGGYLVFRKR